MAWWQVIIWIKDGSFTDAYMRHSTSMNAMLRKSLNFISIHDNRCTYTTEVSVPDSKDHGANMGRTLEGHLFASFFLSYRQVSIIRRTLVGNKNVDPSDVVGAAPVSAQITSSFST